MLRELQKFGIPRHISARLRGSLVLAPQDGSVPVGAPCSEKLSAVGDLKTKVFAQWRQLLEKSSAVDLVDHQMLLQSSIPLVRRRSPSSRT